MLDMLDWGKFCKGILQAPNDEREFKKMKRSAFINLSVLPSFMAKSLILAQRQA